MKRDDMYDFLAGCNSYRSLEPLFAAYAEILKSYRIQFIHFHRASDPWG